MKSSGGSSSSFFVLSTTSIGTYYTPEKKACRVDLAGRIYTMTTWTLSINSANAGVSTSALRLAVSLSTTAFW